MIRTRYTNFTPKSNSYVCSRKRKNCKIMIEEPKWYLYFMINSKYNNAKELIPTLFGDFSCFSGNEALIVVLLFKYIMVKYCNRDQTCMQAGGTRGKPSVICGFKVVWSVHTPGHGIAFASKIIFWITANGTRKAIQIFNHIAFAEMGDKPRLIMIIKS